jgi:hypothetical protein
MIAVGPKAVQDIGGVFILLFKLIMIIEEGEKWKRQGSRNVIYAKFITGSDIDKYSRLLDKPKKS